MKLLPWVFAALLAIAVVGLWTERRNSQTQRASAEFTPLAPSSTVTTAPSRERADPLPESGSLEVLTEEIRGLRADLKSLLAEQRTPIGENEMTSELRRLITTLEKVALSADERGSITLDATSAEAHVPAILSFHERANATHQETKRSYLLRSQQEILSEFGVPDSVHRSAQGVVIWGYTPKNPMGEDKYIGVSFIDGSVSDIHVSD